MDGVRATLGLWQFVQARDWPDFYTRLYDPDVLPMIGPPPTAEA